MHVQLAEFADLAARTAPRATLILLGGVCATQLLRRRPASTRHHIWSLAVAGALLLPLLILARPHLPLPTLGSWPSSSIDVAPLDIAGDPRWTVGHGSSFLTHFVILSWALGSLVFVLRIARAHLAAHRLLRATAPFVHPMLRPTLASTDGAIEFRSAVRFIRVGDVSAPLTVGLLRQRVVPPLDATSWPMERLRLVLLHELGHVHRHDGLTQLMADLATGLYWWNPLAWYARARMRVERECACDDLVLLAGVRPSTYAAELVLAVHAIAVHAARTASQSVGQRPSAGLAGASMADADSTELRVRRILDASTARSPRSAAFRVLAPL